MNTQDDQEVPYRTPEGDTYEYLKWKLKCTKELERRERQERADAYGLSFRQQLTGQAMRKLMDWDTEPLDIAERVKVVVDTVLRVMEETDE